MKNTTLVIAFFLSGVSLICSLLIYIQHRRSGTPIPGYEVGATIGSIALPLGLLGTSTFFQEGVSMVLVVVASLLSITSAVLVSRALRQMRSNQ